jgi:hypothetical protein
MSMTVSGAYPRRNVLAACVAASFVWSTVVQASTFTITNCNDTGAGSLRDALINAITADVIDMTGLTSASPGCSNSTISLATGDFVLAQNSLTIKGPGINNLTVSGKYNLVKEPKRIFTHVGTGTLAIQDLAIVDGYLTGTGAFLQGGCIYSAGNVALTNVAVDLCQAADTTPTGFAGLGASGGAIFTKGSLSLTNCLITNNYASSPNNNAFDGAFTAGNGLTIVNSTISHNGAVGSPSSAILQGGAGSGVGVINISGSTISDNFAGTNFGAMLLEGPSVTINNSTITGNHVTAPVTAQVSNLLTYSAAAHFNNTTIVFNAINSTAATSTGGLDITGPNFSTADFESTLIAENYNGLVQADLDSSSIFTVTVSGNNNLIRIADASVTVPGDTLATCPLLYPLAFNGGPTKTHRQERHSPGTDVGNNSQGFANDQRGAPFPRVSGSAADIGAYEIDQSDIIFDSRFETCG